MCSHELDRDTLNLLSNLIESNATCTRGHNNNNNNGEHNGTMANWTEWRKKKRRSKLNKCSGNCEKRAPRKRQTQRTDKSRRKMNKNASNLQFHMNMTKRVFVLFAIYAQRKMTKDIEVGPREGERGTATHNSGERKKTCTDLHWQVKKCAQNIVLATTTTARKHTHTHGSKLVGGRSHSGNVRK